MLQNFDFILDDSLQDAKKTEELKETMINEAPKALIPESRWGLRKYSNENGLFLTIFLAILSELLTDISA